MYVFFKEAVSRLLFCGSCGAADVRQTIADDIFKVLEADMTIRILICIPVQYNK